MVGLIPDLPCMAYGEDGGHVALVPIEYDVSGAPKRNEPLSKTSPRRFDRSPNVRMHRQRFHAKAYRANGTCRRITISRCEECMQAGDVTERGSCPYDPRHESTMRLGRLGVLSVFQSLQPGVRLFRRDVHSGGLVFIPGIKPVLKHSLPPLFTIEVLVDRIAHQPLRWFAACVGEAP